MRYCPKGKLFLNEKKIKFPFKIPKSGVPNLIIRYILPITAWVTETVKSWLRISLKSQNSSSHGAVEHTGNMPLINQIKICPWWNWKQYVSDTDENISAPPLKTECAFDKKKLWTFLCEYVSPLVWQS